MRICVVSGTFHPEPGGPPTYLYHLLPELVRRGHQVEVVTYGEAGAPGSYPYPVTRISRRPPIALRLLAFTRAVLKAGRQSDAFFVSDYGLPAALANLILRRPMVIKVVADFSWEYAERHRLIPHGQGVVEFQAARHSPLVRLLRVIQGAYVRAAHQVIVPSQHVAALVSGWGLRRERLHVIYNAPDLGPFLTLPPAAEARQRLGWSDQTVITVARLAPVKGVDVVIDSLAMVRRRFPEARLVVVGEGPARAQLEARAAQAAPGAVTFAGRQPRDGVALRLRAAAVCVLASRTEGLPHVPLEAMAAETPVVATQVGGTPELIAHESTGLLVPPDDPPAIAAAVMRVLSDRALAESLASGGLRSLERFSWRRMVDATEAVLREALESAR